MKKTYVKITSLICVLILAVMLLGCALFTYIEISLVNKQCFAEIHNNSQILPEEFNAAQEDVETYMVNQRGAKFLASSENPNIGYYGKCSWILKGTNLTNIMESTRFTKISAIMNKSGNGTSFTIIVPENDKVEGKVYVDFDSSVNLHPKSIEGVAYSTDDSRVITIISSKELAVVKDSSSFTTSYDNPDKLEGDNSRLIDTEAKNKYKELLETEGNERMNLSETGWLTSYVVYSSNNVLMNGDLNLNECDIYLFHPLAIVLSNYLYVYILFAAVLLVMLFLTIVTMRRIYMNRMSYEARTQSLTRSFAHELKTPLAVTKSYVENWDIVDEKERPEVATKINTEVDHMTKMVNTLLDLSKMESGDMKLDIEEVELFELSKACYKHVESIAKERELEVEFKKDKEDGEYFVSADLDMMRMVISNFLSNAIKYGKEKVLVSLSSSSNNVTFRITNDGEPISRKDQKRIWDLFYTKDKSGTDRLNSNGVGLAVNKSILELHKAKFGVESMPAGNSFWFEMKKAKE